MKGSAKPRTGAHSGKGKSGTGRSTPAKAEPLVLSIEKGARYAGEEDFKFDLHIRDVVSTREYEWDRTELEVFYNTVGGAAGMLRLGPGDVYRLGKKKISFERVKMILDNKITEVEIDRLPE